MKWWKKPVSISVALGIVFGLILIGWLWQDRLKAVGGQLYFVGTDGIDSATSGHQIDQPFKSINFALSQMGQGDILQIKAGTYTESIKGLIPAGVTIEAYDRTQLPTIVNPNGDPGPVFLLGNYKRFSGTNQRDIIIRGLIIDGNRSDFSKVNTQKNILDGANDGIKITDGAHNITIGDTRRRTDPKFQATEIKRSASQGILITNQASKNNKIINANIHDNGLGNVDYRLQHGIYITTDGNLIEGNWVYKNSAHGIHKYNGGSNNIIRNNYVFGNSRGGGTLDGAGIGVYNGTNNQIYNNIVRDNAEGIAINYNETNDKIFDNTVVGNQSNGIRVGETATDNSIFNNIVTDSKNVGIYLDNLATNLKNNLLKRNCTSCSTDRSPIGQREVRWPNGVSVQSANSIIADPQFVNPGKNNFNLKPTSPAIDGGANLAGQVEDDFVYTLRPQGRGFDIGAYEYTAVPFSDSNDDINGSISGLDESPASCSVNCTTSTSNQNGTNSTSASDNVTANGNTPASAGTSSKQTANQTNQSNPTSTSSSTQPNDQSGFVLPDAGKTPEITEPWLNNARSAFPIAVISLGLALLGWLVWQRKIRNI